MKIFNFLLFFMMAFSSLLSPSWASSGREVTPFNEGWQFRKVDGLAEVQLQGLSTHEWEQVTVPHSFSQDMQEGKVREFYEGKAIYQNTLPANKLAEGRRSFLHFQGVGNIADVFVNGKWVGKNEGSFAAFCFEITGFLDYESENTVEVLVDNTAKKDIIPTNHFLFGLYGGIYRPVTLITTEQIAITPTDYASSGVYVSQKEVTSEKAELGVLVKVENRTTTYQDAQIKFEILDAEGKAILSETIEESLSPQGLNFIRQDLEVASPRLWHGMKDPYLHQFVTTISQDGTVIDQITEKIGFRDFEIKPGEGFYLNGEKMKLYGVNRHQDRWGKANALSYEDHLEDMELIKEVGANSIRFAHYQQAKDIYNLSDEMGFIIWAEIPWVNKPTKEEADNAKLQLRQLIRQNYNHPSIYVWGVHNEVYGKEEGDFVATLTRELHDLAKNEDPYRYTASVNGWGHMDHQANNYAEIQGINRYFGWYEGKIADMKPWVEKMQAEYPKHRVILAEYGPGINIDHQDEDSPETFVPTQNGNFSGKFFPESYGNRFHEVQWSIIEGQDYLVASYIWNMFDFALPLWTRGNVPKRNHKGLITFDRQTKKDVFYWYKANWNTEDPMVYISERRANQRKHQETKASIYSNQSEVTFTHNGQAVEAERGYTDNHFLFPITLAEGENVLKAVIEVDGQKIEDEIIWNYDPKQKNQPQE